MRYLQWLRYGLASVVVTSGAMGAFLVGCADDDDPIVPVTDGGDHDGSTPGEDGGEQPDGGPTTPPAKLILVNAATSLGAENPGGIRVCFATKTATETDFAPTPFPILPNEKSNESQLFPGIFVGQGGSFPNSGANLEQLSIRPYVMNAAALALRGIEGSGTSVPRCDSVIRSFGGDAGVSGDGGAAEPFVPGVDYWQLPDIPLGTLKAGHAYILALTGCAADAPEGSYCGNGDSDAAYVPTGEPGVGNLKILIAEIDTTTTVAENELGVQVLNASPQFTEHTELPFNPIVANIDGGAAQPVGPEGAAVPFDRNVTAATPVVKATGLDPASAIFAVATGEGPEAPLPFNNAAGAQGSIQLFTTGSTDAAPLYVNGKVYTVVAVGDPGVDAGVGLPFFRYLGFDNGFTPPSLGGAQ